MVVPEHIKVASKVGTMEDAQFISTNTELTGLTGAKTKYNEDIYFGSHTTVFGSYYCKETRKWGYKCCKSTKRRDGKCKVALAEKAPLLKKVAEK